MLAAAVVVLGCTACSPAALFGLTQIATSSGSGPTIAHKGHVHVPGLQLPKKANQVIVFQTGGVGNQSLGTFTVHGSVLLETVCLGPGSLGVEIGSGYWSRPCNGSAAEIQIPRVHGRDTRISVRANSYTMWAIGFAKRLYEVTPRRARR